jgi:energy-coupling factor transporter ATP-binding protein EcfA2
LPAQFHVKAAKRLGSRVSFHVADFNLHSLRRQSWSQLFFNFLSPEFPEVPLRIKSIRIQNFRSFQDETIHLNRYSCFVGPNGAGKSSVLAALNVFFREQSGAASDVTKLIDEDYFGKTTANPVRITVTFDDLNQAAQTELSAYVRQDGLVVTAEAVFDATAGFGAVKYFGQRSGMAEFRGFFEAEKAGAKAGELAAIFDTLRQQFQDLPNPRSKDDKAEVLRTYESARPDRCVLIPSEDNFYGVNSTGKLAAFAQWFFVPAVKDAVEEGQEEKVSSRIIVGRG